MSQIWLTQGQARDLRREMKSGRAILPILAEEMGVSLLAAARMTLGETYHHVSGEKDRKKEYWNDWIL